MVFMKHKQNNTEDYPWDKIKFRQIEWFYVTFDFSTF